MQEEIKRILKMVEEGKIDSDKAAELIEALNSQRSTQQLPKPVNGEKMLKVRVLSGTSDQSDKVNVNIPVSFLKAVGAAVNNMKIPGISDQEGIDVRMIMDAIDSGLEGKIVDIKTADGELVEVAIE